MHLAQMEESCMIISMASASKWRSHASGANGGVMHDYLDGIGKQIV